MPIFSANVKKNGTSYETNLGPLHNSNYTNVENGTMHSGTHAKTDLGPVGSAYETNTSTFGKEGVGKSHAEGWNIGGSKGVGATQSHEHMWSKSGYEETNSASSNLFGLKNENTTTEQIGHGKIYSYHTEGKFFGHEYSWGFSIPKPKMPTMKGTGEAMGKAARSTCRFFSHASSTMRNGASSAMRHAPGVAENVGHDIAEAARFTGRNTGRMAGGAGRFFQSAGHVVTEYGPQVVNAVVEVAKVVAQRNEVITDKKATNVIDSFAVDATVCAR